MICIIMILLNGWCRMRMRPAPGVICFLYTTRVIVGEKNHIVIILFSFMKMVRNPTVSVAGCGELVIVCKLIFFRQDLPFHFASGE